MSERPLHLFEATGIELEYAIVDGDTLDVRPVADELLRRAAPGGTYAAELSRGAIAWSNELALHVVELKVDGPVASLDGVDALFQAEVAAMNALLAPMGCRLLPTAMHPWMDPDRELRLWPHEYSPVYAAFDRIFDCRGHGWANLQSTHINLPFCGDDEFGRLHAAVRLVLPVLAGLAASSPAVDGRLTGLLDNRLEVYRQNARRIGSVMADVIPESVFTEADYRREILEPIYRDLAPLDPEGVLRHEWANARGAIARFSRGAIEIRVLDVQECPRQDLAVVALVTAAVRALCEERWVGQAVLRGFAVPPLAALFRAAIRDAERTVVDDPDYLRAFGINGRRATAGELWQHLAEALLGSTSPHAGPLALIAEHGCLARRITTAVAAAGGGRPALRAVYGELADCLAEGRGFRP